MAEWWEGCSRASFNMAHGLLRALAQLYFGEQTEDSIKLAAGWLRRRLHYTPGFLLELLAERVHPSIVVYKSPSIVYNLEFLQRAHGMFPRARFIHLLQHPRSHGEGIMKAIQEAAARDRVPQWLVHLATFSQSVERDGVSQELPEWDPQKAWYALHRNIIAFLESIPEEQKLVIRGEDVLSDPDPHLLRIASWMGLRTDQEAIEAMKHPDRSPYACFGPPGARYGNDAAFLQNPTIEFGPPASQSLEGRQTWRDDEDGFSSEVIHLAQQFGYE